MGHLARVQALPIYHYKDYFNFARVIRRGLDEEFVHNVWLPSPIRYKCFLSVIGVGVLLFSLIFSYLTIPNIRGFL